MKESEIIHLLRSEINRDFLPNKVDNLLIGDDCAIIDNLDMQLCMSVDTLLAGVHFPAEANPFLIGNRAIGACASDLAAMGAQPYGFLLALQLPQQLANREYLLGLAAGMRIAALRIGMPLIGGNISRAASLPFSPLPISTPLSVSTSLPSPASSSSSTSSPSSTPSSASSSSSLPTSPGGSTELLGLSLTVLGNGESMLKRQGAMPGDSIYVSGYLGDGAAGLEYATKLPSQLTAAQATLRAAYFCPAPRIALGRRLKCVASSCMDISDGLATDIRNLLGGNARGGDAGGENKRGENKSEAEGGNYTAADISKKHWGAIINAAQLPLSEAMIKEYSPAQAQKFALFGGDDYELLFTVAPEQQEKLAPLAAEFNLTCIGEVSKEKDLILMQADNSSVALGKAGGDEGYQHF